MFQITSLLFSSQTKNRFGFRDRLCTSFTWKAEKGWKWVCWNAKNFNLWIFSGGLSSLRLMWNIEKPRTHSRPFALYLWIANFFPEKMECDIGNKPFYKILSHSRIENIASNFRILRPVSDQMVDHQRICNRLPYLDNTIF